MSVFPTEVSSILSAAPTASTTATLSQELSEFLLELALALQRIAMYPGGHPSVDAAVGRLTATVQRLLLARETLTLGVARRQIVVEGVATETAHPVLASLAERLHRHRLGALAGHRALALPRLRRLLASVGRHVLLRRLLGARL